jgi:hypothetical protein
LATGNSEFRTQLSTYLRAKAELLASVTAHRTLTGTGRELALIQYFEGLVPRRFEVLTGTVLAPPTQGKFEAQVDLMFVNTHDYPVLVREGSLAVVVPQSVHTAIEVKTRLDTESVEDALLQMRRVHRCLAWEADRNARSILFCYGNPAKSETLSKYLNDAWISVLSKESDWRASDLPDVIITSGAKNGCLAVRDAASVDKVAFELEEISANTAMSELIYRTVRTLSPAQPTETAMSLGWNTVLDYFVHESNREAADHVDLQLPPAPAPKDPQL